MFYGFQTALSALNATSTAIDVTANNLANLNTTGFKQSQVSFQDLFAQSLGSFNSAQPGFGVASPQIVRQFAQGSMQSTAGSFDAAIQGDGFFVLRDPATGAQQLSRAGSFKTDKSGNLQSTSGARVQGWTQLNPDGTVNMNGPIGDIQLPTGSLRKPVATQNFSLNANLDASATVGGSTGTFSQPVQVIDSLGNTQTLSITFTKTGSNAWAYAVTIPASALTTPPPAALATGNLTFDSSGNLVTPAPVPPSTTNQIPVTVTGLADGAADLSLNWNLSDATGKSTFTQIVEPSTVSGSTQDGIAAAQLTKVGIGNGGAIIAGYSNGQQQQIGQLALATVRNPESLSAVGNNNYQLSASTAAPVIGSPGTGGRGTILGGSLESSTVDIATEFTSLIVYQRSYQANAKVVTTEDQLSQETINIKQ
jgi:flagellar hook protein FlgE